MDFGTLLRFAVERDASDIHVQAGLPPMLRLGGTLRAADVPPVTDDDLHKFVRAIAPARFHDELDDRITKGLDFSYAMAGLGRFRCSAYRQLGTIGVSLRVIKNKIRTVAELQLPPVISEIAMARRGLTLITGTTGSGKSTTLAAMLDLINSSRPAKIITIEDPVEYLHTPKQSLIAQLEIGSDTPSFEQALRQAMRQDPDVILVGELRDMDTLRVALRAADTGHQVFSTVHSASAPQTIERIIAMFPPAEQKLLLTQLANNLEAIISQRLLACRDGSRRPAVEILRGGPVAARYILENKSHELTEYIKSGGSGQQTFDQHLIQLYNGGCVTHDEVMHHASNRDAIGVAMRGITARGGGAAAAAKPAGGQPPPMRPAAPTSTASSDSSVVDFEDLEEAAP